MRNKHISLVLALSLLCQQSGLLYAAGEINLANYLSQAKGAMIQPDVFQPARLRYISYDSRNNDFKLLLDKGDAKLNDSTRELFNYFLIGLALPNDTFWVNLRPDAPENIIDPILEKTDIGKIFLEADLQLKKDTASLTSPQNPEGKLYWDKLYKKAGELFGSENITIPTITRPWIVPNEVIVRETEDSVYIYKATLKVMLEADYLIGRGGSRTAPTLDQYAFSDPRLKELNEYSSRIIRETIIPKLTREVNSSKRYAKLRQVYYSLVLARWFKQKYSSLGSVRASGHQSIGVSANNYLSLIDSKNLANLISPEPCDKQTYFQAYQKSFKDGEYNLKETVPTPFSQSIRNYISGGIITRMDISILGNPGGELVTKTLADELTPDRAATFSGSPLNRDVRDDLRKIYNNYSGVKSAIKIIELFINGDNKDENYIRYLEDTLSSLSVFEGVKDLHESFRMAYEIFYKANEHKQRNEEGELTQEISVKLNEKGFLDEFAELQKKMDRLKEDPYRLPWIKEILGQIDLFLYEFNDVEDPGTVSRLKEIKKEIGDLTRYIDVNEKWKGGIRKFLIDKTGQRTGNRRKAIKDAVEKIDEIIEVHQKDGDIESGNFSGSPLTAHILSYDERSKIIEIKKELSILTIEVAHLLDAYPDLKGRYREVLNKIKEFDRRNDILGLAGIMKEFYGAVSRYERKNGGNAISDKIKEWAEVQDIVNKAIEIINKSIDEDIESEHNQLTEVPPGYGGDSKDYCDDVKMLLEKKDFAGAASWMIQWWQWQNNVAKVEEWREISGELKIINMRSGLPHYFSSPALIRRGGIDLTDRFMRLKIERTGSFADLKLSLPQVRNAQSIDLDREFRQIEALASSGIVPNSRRILELFSACYSRGEFGQRLPEVISCLKASSAIQEKLAIDSDDDFRLCLLLPEIFSDGG